MKAPLIKLPVLGALMGMLISLAAAEVAEKSEGAAADTPAPQNPEPPTVALEKPDEATMKVVNAAMALQKEKKYEEAEKLLKETMAAGNDHIALSMVLAANYALQKDFKNACGLFEKSWKVSHNADVLEGYSISLLNLKDFDGLRAITEDLLANFAKLKMGRLAVLMIAATDSNPTLFNRAIVKFPAEELKADPQLPFLLAQTAHKLAMDATGKSGGANAAAPAPPSPGPPAVVMEKADKATMKIVDAVRALQKEKKYAEAEALITKTLAAGNDHVVIHLVHATNYTLQEDYKSASGLYQKVWQSSHDIGMLEAYAMSLMAIKDSAGLKAIAEDLLANFDKLKQGRMAVFMAAGQDSNQALFNRALAKISVEELKADPELSMFVTLTAAKLAQDSLGEKK